MARSIMKMRGTQLSRRTGPDEWALPGRSLSQPTADSSLYAREPLYRPRPEMFIGARLFSVVGAPHPSGLRPATLSVGEGDLPGGGLGYRALRDDEGVFLPHPSRLRRATFPVGEGDLRRGVGIPGTPGWWEFFPLIRQGFALPPSPAGKAASRRGRASSGGGRLPPAGECHYRSLP